MWKLVSIWKNPYARSKPRPTPIMGFVNPFGHSGAGGGGRDVIQEKRTYGWFRRVYGQICFASALGATSDWGEISVQNPGDTADNRYGTPAYLIPGSAIRKASGGGNTTPTTPEKDTYDVEETYVDAYGNEQTQVRTYYKPKAANRDAQKRKAEGKNKPEPGPGIKDEPDTDPPSVDPVDTETIYTRDPIYAPAAHVVSISVTSDAKGMREEGTVTVKSYNGLHVGGPSIGGGMGMSWGYADFTGRVVRSCGFGGQCNGGSVTLDSDGGYTVTVSGARQFIHGGTIGNETSPTQATGQTQTFTDEKGGTYVGNNAMTICAAADGCGKTGKKPEGFSGLISEIPMNYGQVVHQETQEKATGTVYRAHQTLGSIIKDLNKLLPNGVQIIPQESNIDKARFAGKYSAFPFKVLWAAVPYNGSAGEAYNSGPVKWAKPGGGFLDIAFNGEYLARIVSENTQTQTYDGASGQRGLNVVSFINGLIQLANDCCGNAFGQTMCGYSAEPKDKNIYIYDPTYSDGAAGGGGAGFARTATLSFKTSGDQANAIAVGAGPFTSPGGQASSAVVPGGQAAKFKGNAEGEAIDAVRASGIDEACAALQAALIGEAGSNGQMPVPANLSVTTDGTCASAIPGAFFDSGAVPSGNLTVPSGKQVSFIITTIGQSVSGGDWTTTFEAEGMIR